jgi:hypothetical protein
MMLISDDTTNWDVNGDNKTCTKRLHEFTDMHKMHQVFCISYHKKASLKIDLSVSQTRTLAGRWNSFLTNL